MKFYQYINFHFSELEDDAYLENYGNHQPTKEELKAEKRARRHEKFKQWWNTYGDAVKLGALGVGGVAAAGLTTGLLAHGANKNFKEWLEKREQKAKAKQAEKAAQAKAQAEAKANDPWEKLKQAQEDLKLRQAQHKQAKAEHKFQVQQRKDKEKQDKEVAKANKGGRGF